MERKYTGRANIVHLKDFVGSKSDNMYELIGLAEGTKKTSEEFGFRPVGYGVEFPGNFGCRTECRGKMGGCGTG